MDSRRIRPPPAVAWRGAREARDGDGGCGGRADAGRAFREAGPEAAQARSERNERTPRNGPRGRVRRGVRPTQPPGSRRSRTRDAPGHLLREARHRRRPVPKCGEKSEAELGREWDREWEEAKAACTPPSRRAPRDRRVRASPSALAFRNTAPWARDQRRPRRVAGSGCAPPAPGGAARASFIVRQERG